MYAPSYRGGNLLENQVTDSKSTLMLFCIDFNGIMLRTLFDRLKDFELSFKQFLKNILRRPTLDVELIIRLVINKSSPKFTNPPVPIQQARTYFNYVPLVGKKSKE